MRRSPTEAGCEATAILIRAGDARLLDQLAMRALLARPRAAGALLDELHRAQIEPDDEVPADVAGLGALVTFRRGDGPDAEQVLLVAPEQADAGPGRVSALSYLGCGLLGLRPGQSIRWPDRLGGAQQLTVLDVAWPRPSAAEVGAEPAPGPVVDPQEEPAPDAAPGKIVRLPLKRPPPPADEPDYPPGAA